MAPCLPRHCPEQFAVLGQPLGCDSKGVHIIDRTQESGRAVLDHFGQCRASGGDDGETTCHRFGRREAEAFQSRREEERVGTRIGLSKSPLCESSSYADVFGEVCAKFRCASDGEGGNSLKFPHDGREKVNSLAAGIAAHVEKAERPAVVTA